MHNRKDLAYARDVAGRHHVRQVDHAPLIRSPNASLQPCTQGAISECCRRANALHMDHELMVLGSIQSVCESIVLRVAMGGPLALCCQPILDGRILPLPSCICAEILQGDLQDSHYFTSCPDAADSSCQSCTCNMIFECIYRQALLVDNKELFWVRQQRAITLARSAAGRLANCCTYSEDTPSHAASRTLTLCK